MKEESDIAKQHRVAEDMLVVVMTRRIATDTEAGLKSEVTENLAGLLDTDAMDAATVCGCWGIQGGGHHSFRLGAVDAGGGKE